MSFQLGLFDTDSIPGLKAILTSWPSLSSSSSMEDLPAGDGSLFYKSRAEQKSWEFNLELTATSVAEVLGKMDQLTGALDPITHPGLRTFVPNGADGWEWLGVVSGDIKWDRDKELWFTDGIARMTGSVTIITPNPYGYKISSGGRITAPGSISATFAGNAASYLRVEFKGVMSGSGVLSIGDFAISGPLTAGETLVLDFEKLEFYIRSSAGEKVRNVGERITSFDRVAGYGVVTLPVTFSGTAFTELSFTTISRRM